MGETRKIAAILAADVVGFSRMTSADEDRTLAQLRALRVELIDPTIVGQNGRIFKRTGDGALAEFRSVVEAVRCAITIQIAMIERNMGTPADQRIEFRIGVHLGDVVEESDGDLMGDGVNIAARLEGIAEPGAICLSEDAFRQVSGRLDREVTDLGPKQLKNIARPIRAYSLQVGNSLVANPKTETKPLEPRRRSALASLMAGIAVLAMIAGGAWYFLAENRSSGGVAIREPAAHLSIVVLPFTNLSGDPAQDYFADGITENLTTDLSRIRDSFIIARNTAFTYKGRAVDAKQIGKELGVRYALEGSVQRDQNRVRVNAQLIDAETGAHLWADRFDEDIADLFKLQDQIVARLANSLGNELIIAEAQRDQRIEHPDALDLSMRARAIYLRGDRTKESNIAARALYQQALTIDPNDARALAGVASTYMVERVYGWGSPGVDYDAKVVGLDDRSIAIDPGNSYPYSAKSLYLTNSNRPVEGLRAADAGLAINQSDPLLHAARGLAENYLGHFEEGISEAEQAMRLSPRDPIIGAWHNFKAEAELGRGRYDAAIAEANKGIDAGYRVFLAYVPLTAAYALKGDLDQAKTALAEARRLNPNLTVAYVRKRYPDFPWMWDGLRKAGLPEQ